MSSPYPIKKSFVTFWIKSSGFGLNSPHLSSVNLSLLKEEVSKLILSKLCVHCSDNQVSMLVTSWFVKSRLRWHMSITHVSTLAPYLWNSNLEEHQHLPFFKAKIPGLECNVLSQLRPQCWNMLSFQLNTKPACSPGMGPRRLMGFETLFPFSFFVSWAGLLFNTSYYSRYLIKVSKTPMTYIYILNTYSETLTDSSNSFQSNKSIKHWVPYPTFISTRSFTFLTGQTVKRTYRNYVLTLGVCKGKKQKGNTQHQRIFTAEIIWILWMYGFGHRFSLQNFAFGETARHSNESPHSSKARAPIPQRCNWIALHTCLVSQLSTRILVCMFAGSKPLLWHVHPFFYSYSILLQLVALPFVIID